MRELAKKTGTDIKSWTEPGTAPDGKDMGPIRVFFIQARARGPCRVPVLFVQRYPLDKSFSTLHICGWLLTHLAS